MQEKRISDLSISLAAIQAIVATVSLAAWRYSSWAG
jgi:hypothetical protein